MSNTHPHPVRVALDTDGRYTATQGEALVWTYAYHIAHAGTKSERREGLLQVNGQSIDAPVANSQVETPWGVMFAAHGAYSAGWLIAGPHGSTPDTSDPLREGPPLPRDGQWSASTEGWTYEVQIAASGSKSERRAGALVRDGEAVKGTADGETVETPWGLCRWCDRSAYEQGWLFVGCYDRPWSA